MHSPHTPPPSPSRPSPLKELYLKGSRAQLRPSSDHLNYSGENFKVVETLTTTKGEDVKSTRLTRRLTKFLKAKDHHRLVQSANQMRERIVSCRDSLTRWRWAWTVEVGHVEARDGFCLLGRYIVHLFSSQDISSLFFLYMYTHLFCLFLLFLCRSVWASKPWVL